MEEKLTREGSGVESMNGKKKMWKEDESEKKDIEEEMEKNGKRNRYKEKRGDVG